MKTNMLLLISLVFLLLNCQYPENSEIDLSERAEAARLYCQENGLSENVCVLIDMNLHSGKDRLFVYDLKADSIVNQGLCAHGCGNSPWGEDQSKTNPVFSNVPESHCSSLGKYRIGKRGYSSWGIHVNYKLHGLDTTNSNALERLIVLHSWEAIPDEEPFPMGTAEGWGCPAVSNTMMRDLDALLQEIDEPMLMWVYR